MFRYVDAGVIASIDCNSVAMEEGVKTIKTKSIRLIRR